MMLDAQIAPSTAISTSETFPVTISKPLKTPTVDPFAPLDTFARRHLGPGPDEVGQMLSTLGYESLDTLAADVIPPAIQLRRALELPAPLGEREALTAEAETATDPERIAEIHTRSWLSMAMWLGFAGSVQ